MRFLNIRPHVASNTSGKFDFFEVFKTALGKLGALTHADEVVPVTKEFFEGVFKIPKERVSLHFRSSLEHMHDEASSGQHQRHYVEETLSVDTAAHKAVVDYTHQLKVLIRDEIEFTHFSTPPGAEKESLGAVVEFLQHLNADIFLPIYSDAKLVAYLIVDRGARADRLFTDVERDEMLIYCNYLGSLIYLLSTMNLETLQARERALRLEAFKKERLLGLLKQSVYPFVGIGKTRKIGVLTYKNNKFAFINQAAKDLLNTDLNQEKGLAVTRVLSSISGDTASYLSPKRALVNSPDGQTLVAVATPNVQKNNTVVTIANPTIADLIKDHLRSLKDPDKWDYLLALKTTQEGKKIHQVLPADTPTLLSCKISMLEQSLVATSMLIEVAGEEDAEMLAHVVHAVTGQRVLEEIVLRRSADDEGLMCQLFGMNPIFRTDQEKALFEQLDGIGTLVLHNIHLLSIPVQQKLLEYVRFGRFAPYKSDQTQEADVVLVCTTSQDLQDLVGRGLFLKELYLELKNSSVWIPSLTTLPDDEFLALAEGLREQMVQAKVYENMLFFTEYDRRKLLASRCVSLHELKGKIQNILHKKLRKQSIGTETVIDPAFGVVDPDLAHAARLGKHALKDPKMLAMLMSKFKQSQSKIAQFLGVNRSTVSRRCAQFGIEAPNKLTPARGSTHESDGI